MADKNDNHQPDIDIESILPTDQEKQQRDDLFSELEYLSGDSYSSNLPAPSGPAFITSDIFKNREKKEKKTVTQAKEYEGDWFSSFMEDIEEAEAAASMKQRKRTSAMEDILGISKKKKKKKEKKKGEPTDFKKEFEVENTLYTNLLRDNTRFVDSLQREYDSLSTRKASGRGMTKNTQDLISNINAARQLSMNLIEKRVNLKKLATELSMKERKELGLGGSEGTDMGEYGSAYLRKLIDEQSSILRTGSDEIIDESEVSIDDMISANLGAPVDEEYEKNYGKVDRTTEAERYLKYENSGVTVYACIDHEDHSNSYYVARDSEGNELPDYPLPLSPVTTVNESTGYAVDAYGQKYPIEWIE